MHGGVSVGILRKVALETQGIGAGTHPLLAIAVLQIL